DAIIEIENKRSATIVFPDREVNRDHPRLGTLFIPNTLALIKGSPNPEGGRRLVNFLLGADIEAKLAENASHQIPLNPEVKANLPHEILPPKSVHPMAADFEKAADLWERVQTFLRNTFAR